MNATVGIAHLVRGGIAGLALFGAWTGASLLITGSFWPAALPICLVAGIACSLRTTLAPALARPHRDPAWSVVLLAVAVLAVGAAITFGALETPARHWDGVCTWELRADFLADDPTIDQAFFTEPSVFSPSRDYPLLQPLCMASLDRLLGHGMGRLLFPALYLLIVGLVFTAVAGSTDRPGLGPVAAVAIGVTPALVNPDMGSIDSGFADAFLATAVTAIVAGMVLMDPLLAISGVACSVLVKPEGLVYGAIAAAAAWCLDRPRLLRPVVAGWLVAAALWIPLQQQLAAPNGSAPAPLVVWVPIAGLGAVVLWSDGFLRRRGFARRSRLLIALGALPLFGLALPILVAVTGDPGGTMALYLGDATRPLERLQRIPAILAGFVDRSVFKLDFALTYVLVAALLATCAVRRRAPTQAVATGFLVLGLLGILPPFLLSPETDVQHHIRSSMTRLLLHWAGAAWILIAVWIDDLALSERGATPPR